MASDPQSEPGATSSSSGPDFVADFAKLYAGMKLPSLPDMDALVAANRKNMEAFTAANRVALEGAQAVARRHMEIIQQNIAELTEAMRSLATTEAPQEKAARQAALLKQAYERAVGNMKELSDLIQQSNTEALQLINKRFAEAMDEVKAMAQKAK